MTQDRTGRGHVIVVFGPTGSAGTGVIHACLADPGVSEVRAVTRRPLGISHARLREVHCSDFADLGGIAQEFEGVACCLFCLGTSVRNARQEGRYREIHVTYPLAAARTLLAESPDAGFVYLSGAGAKRTSRMMWARVKAEAEDRLAELGLARHANVCPAAILPMQPTGATLWLLVPLVRLIPALGIGQVDLGRAMLRLGLDRSWRGSRTLENRDLKALLARRPGAGHDHPISLGAGWRDSRAGARYGARPRPSHRRRAVFEMQPIGQVRSPYREVSDIPKGCGAEHRAEGWLELRPELEEGLRDIEGFSHLFVIWVFDRAEGHELLVTPPTDMRPHGIFATRAPRRPNPLGLTVVELLGREGPRLHVRGLDMLDGTPILDIKPYLSSIPPEQLRRGWLAEAEERR